MQTIVFDVETGPLAESELSALLPPFDPAEVKTGNLKDPAKIAEKLAEAEANHRRDFIERAALDPLTGRVIAIGMLDLVLSVLVAEFVFHIPMRGELWLVFVASSIALIAVSFLGAYSGRALQRRIPLHRIRLGGGLIFATLGIWTVVSLIVAIS